MSVDHCVRLEQGRSPQPSTQVLRALTRTLRPTVPQRKRLVHPAVGVPGLDCEVLPQPAEDQRLVLLTAAPGSEEQQELQLLRVVGDEVLPVGR